MNHIDITSKFTFSIEDWNWKSAPGKERHSEIKLNRQFLQAHFSEEPKYPIVSKNAES